MDPALWIAALGAVKSLADAGPNQFDRPDGAPTTAGIWTGVGATGLAAVAAKGGLDRWSWGEGLKGSLDTKACPILWNAVAIHAALNLLNGFSTTQKAQDINGGQGWYVAAQDELNDAKAGAGTQWEGRAAEDYSSRNTEQYDRVGRMAQADKDLVVILREQGFEVERLRSDFGGVLTTLLLAFPVAYKIKLTAGEAWSNFFQAAVGGSCVGADIALQSIQSAKAAENAKEITRIVNEYRALTREAEDALPYHS